MTDTPLNTEKDYIPSPERYRNALFSIFYGYTPEQVLKHITENIDPRYEDYINSARKNLPLIRGKCIYKFIQFVTETLAVYNNMYRGDLSFQYTTYNSNRTWSFSIDDNFILDIILPDVLCAVFMNYLNDIRKYKYNSIYHYASRENNKHSHSENNTIDTQIKALSNHWLSAFLGIINLKAPTLYSSFINYIYYSDECIDAFRRTCIQDMTYYKQKFTKSNCSMCIPQNSLLFDTLLSSMAVNNVSIKPANFMFNLSHKYSSNLYHNIYKTMDVYQAERLFNYSFIYQLALSYMDKLPGEINKIDNYDYIIFLFEKMRKLQIHLGKYKLANAIAPIKEIVSVSEDWSNEFNVSNYLPHKNEVIDQLLSYINEILYPIIEATLIILLEFQADDIELILNRYIKDGLIAISNSVSEYIENMLAYFKPNTTIERKNTNVNLYLLNEKQKKLFNKLNELNAEYYNNFVYNENKIYIQASNIENLFSTFKDTTNDNFNTPQIKTHLDGFADYFRQTSVIDVGKQAAIWL